MAQYLDEIASDYTSGMTLKQVSEKYGLSQRETRSRLDRYERIHGVRLVSRGKPANWKKPTWCLVCEIDYTPRTKTQAESRTCSTKCKHELEQYMLEMIARNST